MQTVNEEYHEFINIYDEETAYNAVVRSLVSAAKTGEIKPGQRILIEEDGIIIGEYRDFDADSLYNADRVEEIIDPVSGTILGEDRLRLRVRNLFV